MRFAALILCLALPAAAQTPAETAEAAAQRLHAAAQQMQAAEGARDRIKALTETVLAYEDGLGAMRSSLRQAARQEAAIQAELTGKREELAGLLGVLSTITQTPRPALLLHPQGPLGAARAGMMTAELTPALRTQVTALQEQLRDIRDLKTMQEDAEQTLVKGLQQAQTARAALAQAMSDRTDLPLRFIEDPIQTALLVAGASSLEAFADRLAAHAPDANAQVRPAGNLPLPVNGRVLSDGPSTRPGIFIAANPRALVTTPSEATLLFRGALLDYGQVVILEPSAGVLFVISGLHDVFGIPGQILPAGSPIGLLGEDKPGVDGFLTETPVFDGSDAAQTLYLEVREGQSPVNPAAWFALE